MSHHHLQRPPVNTPALYSQDGKGYDALVYAHYFIGANDWFVTEYNPDEDVAFGWACLNGDRQNAELGYVSIAELESIRVPVRWRLPDAEVTVGEASVEYETGWQPKALREAINNLGGNDD